MDSEVIARLKELESKATAGPWEWSDETTTDGFGNTYLPNVLVGADNEGVMCGQGGAGATAEDISIEEKDKAFIAILRTHAKDLIRAAELSEARRKVCEAWRGWHETYQDIMEGDATVEDYAKHHVTKTELRDAEAALAALEAEGAG